MSNHALFRRNDFAMGVQDDRYILVAGGFTRDDRILRSAGLYDVKTGSTIQLPPLPGDSNTACCAGAVAHGFFYVFDYFGPIHRICIHVQEHLSFNKMFKNETEVWESIQFDLTDRMSISCVISDGEHIFVFDDNKHLFLSFHPITFKWKNLPMMLTPRRGFSAAILKNKIYVLGGFSIGHRTNGIPETTSSYLSSVEVYDIHSQSWSYGPDFSFVKESISKSFHDLNLNVICNDSNSYNGLGFSAAIAIKSWIVVTGGMMEGNQDSKSILILNTRTQKWTQHKIELSASRYHHKSAVIEARSKFLFVVGGKKHSNKQFPFQIESIDLNGLQLYHWYTIRHLVLLRKLIDDRRASILNDNQGSGNIFSKLMMDINLDLFRQIITYLF